MSKDSFLFLLKSFLIWRVMLLVFLALAIKLIPLQANFIGGGHINYLKDPILWSGVNFDGEHYLAIAQNGYQPLTYFFFPLYPILVSFLGNIFGRDLETLGLIGIIISHVSFFFALVGLWKLILLDYKEKIAKIVIILLLVFPTSFFFASFYTESMYLMFAVWSFYFLRKERFLLASILGGLSTVTRIIGSVFGVYFFVDVMKNKKYIKLIYVPIIILGIVTYMYYLKTKTGDPLEFFNTISIFGQQRSTHIVLVPQVFYRYIFKILPNINYSNFPSVFTTYLELISGTLFIVLSIVSFWRLKIDYAIYLFLGYIVPTLSGSFSSMPRYVLVLFPGFILLSLYIVKWPRTIRVVYFVFSFLFLIIAAMFFYRGIWIG